MCSITDGFKLCTCHDKLLAQEVGWTLQRSNAELPLHHRKGKATRPHYNHPEQELQQLILANLNAGNCFDFAYVPQENDYIRIKAKANDTLQMKWYGYRYLRNEWRIDSSDSLAGWKTQLEDFKDGKLTS